MADITNEQRAVIEKVQKLLALAGNNTNEHEAEAATAKAMELLAAYNLSMHSVGSANTTANAKRDDKKRKGGLYAWQRALWQEVAQLNFCMYWSIKGLQKGSTYEHRLLGSEVNVVLTETMADYLQGAVERIAQSWAKEQGYKSVFVREAIAFREGMSHGLTARLQELRARRNRDEQAARGNGTALVLADVAQSETDLNNDYLHGWEPGTTSRRRAEDKARQDKAMAAYRATMDARTPAQIAAEEKARAELNAKWEKEAAQREAKRAKNAGKPGYDEYGYKYQYRKETAQEARMRDPSFGAGYNEAKKVNLDRQVSDERNSSRKQIDEEQQAERVAIR